MTTRARPRYTGYRFPAAIISPALWLYFRFPLGLRMVEELLAARGIILSHKTVRPWAGKFGRQFANQIRRRLPRAGDKWHLDEVVLEIAGGEALVVAGGGPDRHRARCPGPTPTRHASCPADAAQRMLRQLLKKQIATATRHDH